MKDKEIMGLLIGALSDIQAIDCRLKALIFQVSRVINILQKDMLHVEKAGNTQGEAHGSKTTT